MDTVEKDDFLPILIGTDLNCYTMSISFHEEYGIKPVVVGRAPVSFTEGSTIIEKFYYTERIDDTDFFIDYLKSLAEKYKQSYKKLLLIGTNDDYVTFIIENEEALAPYFEFNYPDAELVPELFLKKNFYRLCEEHGLNVPLTYFYSCKDEEPFNKEVPFPLVVKPSDGIAYYENPFEGMQKIYIVNNPKELEETIQLIKGSGYREELIIQDYIPGDDTYMYDAVYYGNRNRKAELISFGQVVMQEPTTSGVGNYTALIVRKHQRIMDRLVEFMEEIGYKGFANFDIKFDPRDGLYKLFEVNLRQGRSSYYLTQSGYNIAKTIVDDVIYKKDKEFSYVEGDHLFAVIPKGVLKRYVKDPKIAEEVRQLIKEGKYKNPIFYRPDKGLKRRFRMLLRQINYFRKYKKDPFAEENESSFEEKTI